MRDLYDIVFDFEKAYETTWKYGIMKDLYDIELRGCLPIFIQQFFLPKENLESE